MKIWMGEGGGVIENGFVNSIFELDVVRCGSKIGYQKDMYFKKIGLHVQNMMTILSSIINVIIGPI